ncbi:MAG: PASTA domain-containing protein [Prevotella sp.]|nr:PASTA domain-containing protein [Prevotella sp.]MBQ6161770.1 PASTA domain-containing protein [Prevotella sp.]MBQ6187630.1 PASTA domain-containing protein [Prevotella sp.]
MKESTKKSGKIGRYVAWNLVAMAVVCLLLFLGVKFGLNMYTHHGEAIAVPDVKNKPADAAMSAIAALDLVPLVTDTGYVKKLPPGCVLEQVPVAGSKVKSGHVVRLVLNASSAPMLKLPDIIDNSSLRTAMSRLSAMGFKMGLPEFVPGEKEWVLGVKADGKNVSTGDKISTDATIVIQVGNGMIGEDDSITFVDPVIEEDDMQEYEYGDVDDFVEVDGPPEGEKKESE